MTESQIEKAVCDHARKRGAIVMKLSGNGPDCVFLYEGKSLFVKFSKPDTSWQTDLAFHGFTTAWTENAEDGIHYADETLFDT